MLDFELVRVKMTAMEKYSQAHIEAYGKKNLEEAMVKFPLATRGIPDLQVGRLTALKAYEQAVLPKADPRVDDHKES